MPKWACNFLRNEFLAKTKVEKLQKLERIYISRFKATRRRVINEAEVTKILNPLGFQLVFSELMSISEQASIFSSAKIIIAPHGAGLTNLVFCDPGTKVVEFFSPNYVNLTYWALSNQMNLEYYYLLGEGQLLPEFLGNLRYRLTEDIFVNLDSLSDLLRCLL